MKKKNQRSSFAMVLVTIAVPTVALGIAVTSAASEINTEPRSQQFELFNIDQFRFLKREIRMSAPATPSSDAVHPAATVKPCDSVDETSSSSSASAVLTVQDLTTSQRETLRRQLRIGGCPQDADPAYKALCESLLKQQKPKEYLKGLKHPEQQ